MCPTRETPVDPIVRTVKIGKRQTVGAPFGPGIGMIERLSTIPSRLHRTPKTDRSHTEPEEPPSEIAPLKNVAELVTKQRHVIDKARAAKNTNARQSEGTPPTLKRINRHRIHPNAFKILHRYN